MSDIDTTAADDDWMPDRRYSPGTCDQILVSQRARETQEREKSEANRPTGTEIGQITAKLRTLTEQLKEQQKQLETAQEDLEKQQGALEKQQTDMVRRTPQPEGRTQYTASAAVGTAETTIHTYGIAIPSGKAKAFVAVSARASTPTHDGTPLLEIYEDGKLVGLMTIPDILPANGLSFCQTVGENHTYTIRARTATGGATITGVESWFTVIYYV
ncbi:MAG: hypothetical protein SOI13_05395 [Bifidobacterium mongoliense]|uniref:hypothetical protein n=1 Tax=Bifidobacterium mongoliense TaxID=518643 RepID=UPI002F3520CC